MVVEYLGQIIYAPMRKDYYYGKKPTNCQFCELDKSVIIIEQNSCIMIANKYPYVFGHLLIVPKRHVETIEDLNKDEDKDMMLLSKKAVRMLRNTFNPEGFNIGINIGEISGGSIKHLHIHIVPRYKGDTGFMNVLNDTSISSMKPEEMIKKLKEKNGIN